MKIIINDSRTIKAVQEAFNKRYPFLKLEFYAKPSRNSGGSSKKIVTDSSRTIGDCRTLHNNGNITISPEMTVSELHQRFLDVYGLHVQLFRKSGKVWIDTSVTDGWTLNDQNREGENLSKELNYK